MFGNRSFLTKIICILVAIAMLLGILSSFFYADQSKASSWAAEEVDAAIQLGIVPQELLTDYTAAIKRSEYTSLALSLFKKAGFKIIINNDKPFPDINGSYYESTIIEAFNAGIVDGYPDGTFKPEDFISRQEIAKLIVNLVKAMYKDADTHVSESYIFNDNNMIGDWAKPEVDFCFENQVIKGVSDKNIGPAGVTIDPIGKTTREQAIIMIYRLARNWRLIDEIAEPVALTDILFYFSEPLFYNVLQANEEKLLLKSKYDIYDIRITKINGKVKFTAETKDASDEEFRTVLSTLLLTSHYPNKTWDLFEENLNAAAETGKMDFAEQIVDKYLINGYTSNNADNTITFILKLQEY